MHNDRRRQLLERDLRAALDVPEAAGPGVVEHLQAELARLDGAVDPRNTKSRPATGPKPGDGALF